EAMWKKNITHTTADFILDEETNQVKAQDGETAIIGGMITGKTIKTTRSNSMMAFVTVEDLLGTTEVIVFPRDYEKNKFLLEEESKVFIKGKISVEEEKPAKLICQSVMPFDKIPRELWIQFKDKEDFQKNEQILYEILSQYDGDDGVCIYLKCEKLIKRLPKNRNIKANKDVLTKLAEIFQEKDLRIQEKSIVKKQF
ncbi:MAG: OB-fold nucleic acid binding domain-containing protein, partial [Acetivibrio sp.]